MTTTIDASGVETVDATLVAVRLLSPRAVWTRSKIRALQILRAVRERAAHRQAAIAQFVKPYWERIPAGLPGFALLGAMCHSPTYSWMLNVTESVNHVIGRTVRGGLSWIGRGINWVGRQVIVRALGVIAPVTASRLHVQGARMAGAVEGVFGYVCDRTADQHRKSYAAMRSTTGHATVRRYALPLFILVGINIASQGLIAATVSAIPFVGIPLAAMISTSRGMTRAAMAICCLADWNGRRSLKGQAPVEEVVAAAATEVKEDVKAEAADAVQGTVTTREVLSDGNAVVIQVQGENLTPEQVQEIAKAHLEKSEADLEADLKVLEAEARPQTAAQKRAAAKAHGPQAKRRGRPPGTTAAKKAAAATS